MASPSSLECTGVHVVHQDALVAGTVRNINLAGVLIEVEIFDAGQYGGLLVVLLELFAFGPAMPKIPEKLSVTIKLDDAVAQIRS